MRIKKLTAKRLHSLVLEEKARYNCDLEKEAKKTKKVEADGYADTLEKDIDHLAALKIKEAQKKIELKQIQEQSNKIKRRLRLKS